MRFALALLLYAVGAGIAAQSFPGYALDNYSGIPGLLLNPANVADSRLGFELHLASVSGAAANDYFTLGKGLPFDEDIWDDGLVRTPRNDNSLFVNVDAIGPSLLIGLGKRSGLALVTRARSVYNIDGFNGTLYEGVADGFGDDDFSYDQQEHHSSLHGWGEASLVFGTVLRAGIHSLLKAGASVKYLRGVGGVYTDSPFITGTYDRSTTLLRTDGEFTYGSVGGVDFSDPDLDALSESLGNGVGFDLGVVYEWRPGEVPADRLRHPYRLKVAASVVDIGAIEYSESYGQTYLTDATIWTRDYNGESLEYFLDDHFDGTEFTEAATFRLPTALHFLVDLRLSGGLYLSAISSNSLRPDNIRLTNHIPSTLTLAPRLETKWLGLYSPLTFGGDRGTSWGAGVRFSFITVGSGSILSQLLSDNSQAADGYASLRIPFYRANRIKSKKGKAKAN